MLCVRLLIVWCSILVAAVVTGSNDAYSGLTWFLQISDVHISHKHQERTDQFKEFVDEYLEVFKPDLVLCTGDLTDAKVQGGMASKQVLSEWESYYNVVSSRNLDIPWLDIRGNHDNLNVLNRSSHFNYFRNYSSMGRKGELESYLFSKRLRGQNYNFVALDATLDVGMRFPLNFIGDISEHQQQKIRALLDQIDEKDVNIFFGHYPSSTVRQKEFLLETVNSGLVYLNGHLHDLSSFRVEKLYSFHGDQNLELELVDWKHNRAYRLLAVDQQFLSFTDLRFGQWPVILPTLPKNSEFLLVKKEPDFKESEWNKIRILVFSPSKITSVKVYLDDSEDELVAVQQGQGPLYTCTWNPKKYRTGLHTMRVTAQDNLNRTNYIIQTFALDKSAAVQFYLPFSSFVLGASFSKFFQICYGVAAVISIFYLPTLKLLTSLTQQRKLPIFLTDILHKMLQFCYFRKCNCVASVKPLFYFFTLFPAYLAVGPWVYGSLVEDSHGAAFAWGTFVNSQYLNTEVGYFKYALHTLIIHPMVLFICGHILDTKCFPETSTRKRDVCRTWLMHLVALLFCCAVIFAFFFESIIFWLQFGVLGIFFGILNTWTLIFYGLVIYWSLRVSKTTIYTNIILEDHGKKTDDEQTDDEENSINIQSSERIWTL